MCVGFLQRVYGSLVSTHQDLSPTLVEEELVSACAEVQGKESRLVRKDIADARHNVFLIWGGSGDGGSPWFCEILIRLPWLSESSG